MESLIFRRAAWVAAVAAAVALAACDSVPTEGTYPYKEKGKNPAYGKSHEDAYQKKSIFGEGGINIFGGDKKAPDAGAGGIGVNTFLWRATLDAISFMPVASADPFGGVIITDWHSPAQVPSERFKLNVYIMDRALRADGVRVAVFRQVQDPAGAWRDAATPEGTAINIENAILSKARQLRNETLQQR